MSTDKRDCLEETLKQLRDAEPGEPPPENVLALGVAVYRGAVVLDFLHMPSAQLQVDPRFALAMAQALIQAATIALGERRS